MHQELRTDLDQRALGQGQALKPGLHLLHLLHSLLLAHAWEDTRQGVVIAVRLPINHCEHPAVPFLHEHNHIVQECYVTSWTVHSLSAGHELLQTQP